VEYEILLYPDTSLGAIFRAYRIESGMTQAALAAQVGTTGPSVSLFESNEKLPAFTTLVKIVSLLKIPMEDCLERYLTRMLYCEGFELNEYVSFKHTKKSDDLSDVSKKDGYKVSGV
jgi:DNA-binding XRE family transcriptional regulator